MRTTPRRRLAAVATALTLLSTVTVLSATQQTAGADTTQLYACFSPLTSQYATFPLPLTGDAAPNPINPGDPTDVTNLSVTIAVDADLVLAGIGAGVISFVTDASLIGTVDPVTGGDGVNQVANTTEATIAASNTVEGEAPVAGATNVTFFVVSDGVTATLYIDPTGTWSGPADNGNLVVVSSIPVTIALADDGTVDGSAGSPLTVTHDGVGGNIDVASALGPLPANPAGAPTLLERADAPLQLLNDISSPSLTGSVSADFFCWPGESQGPIDPATGLPGSSAGFTPAASASPIVTVQVNQPDVGPVAADDTASVGASQSVTIDVLANDTDANSNIDPTTVTVTTPPAGGTATVNPDGSITYANTDPLLSQDTFQYTVADTTGLVSNAATVTVNILGDLCTAPCDLTQIIETTVVGAAMTLEQAGTGVTLVDSVTGVDIVLDGTPKLAVGDLNQLTVVNARGTDDGWDLTGEVTDFKNDPAVPDCPSDTPASWSNDCIPGDNLGWEPATAVAHTQVLGDVADSTAGSTINPPGFGGAGPLDPTGLANLSGAAAQSLCSAGTGVSGGTFTCDAGLLLSVPASTAAGTYTAVITLTLA